MSALILASSAPADQVTLGVGEPARLIAYDRGQAIDVATFHAHVRGVAALLPHGLHAVNLCENRYRFIVALCAVALRGQVTLLPPSRAPAVVAEAMARHSDSWALGDDAVEQAPAHYLRLPEVLPMADGPAPQVPLEALAVIGFTSGSTGQPKPYPKTWRSFRTSNQQNLAALAELWAGQVPSVVATVPPQHMYGMELSVVMPLLTEVTIQGGKPFFPGDVAQALASVPEPRVLVTTPVHLRALVDSGVQLPPLTAMVSATAPLPQDLAQAAEARFGGQVVEMFGSTETCIFARRRTAVEAHWTPLPGVRVIPQPDGSLVQASHLPQPVPLADLMDVEPDGRFRVLGRQADLLEIAGKRASIGDLTRRLQAIPGVRDGVMVQLDHADDVGVRRIAALVVAPDLDEAAILAALRQGMDPVFLPRRIRFVKALPRAETGKLPRAEVLKLLES
jgi:acyl-coenzyme A synthetase/AMP-(fatty) acid ligase